MARKELETGDPRTLGRFELLARLGEGGQGIVYLGRGPGPGEERVAVKVLRSSVDASVLQRLARELDAIHKVQPFVTARVIEASTEGERRYIVSEFIDGPSLQERVDTRGPLPEGDLQRLAVGTATALTAIHGAGVVHRDFKPANVLLGPDGPRVVDFGIARVIEASTMTSGLIGTPSYISPEQLSGARPTSAVDIFAWAVTMIFAATGRPAFGGDSVEAVIYRIMTEQPDISGVPPSLAPVIRDGLNKDPQARPSARDVLLRLVDPSQPPVATVNTAAPTGPLRVEDDVPGRTGPIAPRSRRMPVLAASGAVVAVALIALVAVLLTRGSPGGTPNGVVISPTAAAATTATTAPAGVTIPAAFAGTWSGTATMEAIGVPSLGLQNSISFTLAKDGTTAAEVNGSCVNTLTLTEATATVLTFSEPETVQCVAGTVTFTRHGGTLAYLWTNGVEQNAATLRKK
jgi:eukaryotic-like serine/threonine-protein kinase